MNEGVIETEIEKKNYELSLRMADEVLCYQADKDYGFLNIEIVIFNN